MITSNFENFGYEEFDRNDDGNFIIDADIKEFTCPWFNTNVNDNLYHEIAYVFVSKKLSIIPEIDHLYRYNFCFLVNLFTEIFANPKRPVRQGKVVKYNITGRYLGIFMNQLVKNGYFVLLMGNTEAGQQPYSKYWYPTINKKVKNELIEAVIRKRKYEIRKLKRM